MSAIAGQTAGPNWLIFFKEPKSAQRLTLAKKIEISFFLNPVFFKNRIFFFKFRLFLFHEQRRALELVVI